MGLKKLQGDQKVSVYLTITVHHQVQREFLITLHKKVNGI
jgi:hypothetical protein